MIPRFVRRRRVAAKLRAAADLLVADGWIQGAPTDEQGRRCLIGALDAAPPADDSYLLWEEAYEAVREHLGVPGIASWNDEPGRTPEQVVAALRETADELDARVSTAEMEARPAGELP